MRRAAFLSLALVLLACAPARFPGVPREGADAARDAEPVPTTADDPEDAREELETGERLSENPVDPRRGGAEALLAIPGFPPALAVRVADARASAGREWIRSLTPPERRALRRFEDVLCMPDERALRVSARLTEGGVAPNGDRRRDTYLSLRSRAWSALWRERRESTARATTFYAAAEGAGGALRLHAGSLCPDFGLGLVFSGPRRSVRYAAPGRLSGARGIIGSSSLSSVVLRGGAVEVWLGPVHAAVFGGTPVSGESGRFERAGQDVVGGRLDGRAGNAEAGVQCAAGREDGTPILCSIDASWRSEEAGAAFEAASRGTKDLAYRADIAWRRDGLRGTFSLHALPGSLAGPLASVDGRRPGAASSDRGVSGAIQAGGARRLRVRASFERYVRAEAFDVRIRESAKLEVERRWRWISIESLCSLRSDDRDEAVPYPGPEPTSSSRSAACGAGASVRVARWCLLDLSLRRAWRAGGSGVLLFSGLDLGRPGGRVQWAMSFAACRISGRGATCWFSEPSLKGEFPLVAAFRETEACASVIIININKLKISSKVRLEDARRPEASVQASVAR